MQTKYARTSILLFGISVLLLILLTVAESALVGTSQTVQRIITLVALVLPALIGIVFGILSFSRKEGRTGLAVAGIILNALFALFHLALVLFAG